MSFGPNESASKKEIARLERAIESWRGDLAEDWDQSYRDESAARIDRPNARHPDDGHRDEIVAWYGERMRVEEKKSREAGE